MTRHPPDPAQVGGCRANLSLDPAQLRTPARHPVGDQPARELAGCFGKRCFAAIRPLDDAVIDRAERNVLRACGSSHHGRSSLALLALLFGLHPLPVVRRTKQALTLTGVLPDQAALALVLRLGKLAPQAPMLLAQLFQALRPGAAHRCNTVGRQRGFHGLERTECQADRTGGGFDLGAERGCHAFDRVVHCQFGFVDREPDIPDHRFELCVGEKRKSARSRTRQGGFGIGDQAVQRSHGGGPLRCQLKDFRLWHGRSFLGKCTFANEVRFDPRGPRPQPADTIGGRAIDPQPRSKRCRIHPRQIIAE